MLAIRLWTQHKPILLTLCLDARQGITCVTFFLFFFASLFPFSFLFAIWLPNCFFTRGNYQEEGIRNSPFPACLPIAAVISTRVVLYPGSGVVSLCSSVTPSEATPLQLSEQHPPLTGLVPSPSWRVWYFTFWLFLPWVKGSWQLLLKFISFAIIQCLSSVTLLFSKA